MAIIYRATLDAQGRHSKRAGEARRWLVGDPLARDLLDLLGLDAKKVHRWVRELEPLEQPALPNL